MYVVMLLSWSHTNFTAFTTHEYLECLKKAIVKKYIIIAILSR